MLCRFLAGSLACSASPGGCAPVCYPLIWHWRIIGNTSARNCQYVYPLGTSTHILPLVLVIYLTTYSRWEYSLHVGLITLRNGENKCNATNVWEFADKDSKRGLENVRFTPQETMATNGHYLVRVTNPPSETIQTTDRAFNIPAESLKPVKVKKGDAVELATNGTGSSWNLTTGVSTFHLEESTTIFPNVDVIMPKDKPVTVIGFDPAYLAKLGKAFAAFADGNPSTVELSFYGPEKPAKFEATNGAGQKMTALLMPRRLS